MIIEAVEKLAEKDGIKSMKFSRIDGLPFEDPAWIEGDEDNKNFDSDDNDSDYEDDSDEDDDSVDESVEENYKEADFEPDVVEEEDEDEEEEGVRDQFT